MPAAVVRGSDFGQGEMATKSESKSAQGMVRESALVQAEGGARWADSSLNEHATNAQSVKRRRCWSTVRKRKEAERAEAEGRYGQRAGKGRLSSTGVSGWRAIGGVASLQKGHPDASGLAARAPSRLLAGGGWGSGGGGASWGSRRDAARWTCCIFVLEPLDPIHECAGLGWAASGRALILSISTLDIKLNPVPAALLGHSIIIVISAT